MKKKGIMRVIDRWLTPLGLRWWEVNIVWVDKAQEIVDTFEVMSNGDIVAAKVHADWKYGVAHVYINLPAFKELKRWKVERIIVHELVHILVNEMREEGIDHEERVVTGLAKAFIWTKG
jgi:hypothetical protein